LFQKTQIMNKVVNVNLGGVPFVIDENAFKQLEKYLKLLKVHFEKTEGSDEILKDIEVRMAEIFQDILKERKILSEKDVDMAIGIMGTPRDLGAEEDWEEISAREEKQREKASEEKIKYKTGKRLFRDPQNEIISGTCSGLAAYFGVQDPVWVRLAFVISALISFGTTALLYIVLWVITPEAITAKDRLMMRGEKIDVDAISKKVKEEFEKVEKQFSDFGDSFKSKG